MPLSVAAIGVPIAAIVFVAVAAGGNHRPLTRLLLPAALGAVAGEVILVLATRVGRSGKGSGGPGVGTVGTALIICAAVLGSSSRDLPIWLDASIWGWALGFFVAFDVLLLKPWRHGKVVREGR